MVLETGASMVVPLRAVCVFLELVRLSSLVIVVVELRATLVLGFGLLVDGWVLNAVFSALRRVLVVSAVVFLMSVTRWSRFVWSLRRRVPNELLVLYGNARAHNSHPQNSPTRSLHGLHDARCVENSQNSVGEWVARGRGVCVPGGTKALSTSNLCQVWRPAVKELAPLQQAPGSLHVETWANQRKPQPEDFPGGGNRSRVCCHGVLPSISFHCSCATWARQ